MNATDTTVVGVLPPLKLSKGDVGRAAFSVTAGLIALSGNSFLVILIGKYRSLRKNDCIYPIACLAVCDSVIGLGIMVYGIGVLYLRTQLDRYPLKLECMAFGVLGVFGVQAGQLATLAIACDRFSALSDPLQYLHQNHRKSGIRWAVFIFLYSLTAAGAMFIGVDFDEPPTPMCNAGSNVTRVWATYWACFSFVNGVPIISLYLSGYSAFLRRSHQMQDRRAEEAMERQRKITTSITFVLAVYSVCWLLPSVGLLVSGMLEMPKLYGTVSPIAAVGSGVNSSVNVLIYGLKHEEIGKHMHRFVADVCKRGISVSHVNDVNLSTLEQQAVTKHTDREYGL